MVGGAGCPEREVGRVGVGTGIHSRLGRQAQLVGVALADRRLTGRDHVEILLIGVGPGDRRGLDRLDHRTRLGHRARLGRRERGKHMRAVVIDVGEGQQPHLAALVVEGETAIHVHPGRIRVAGCPPDRNAHSLAAQLVPEPAHPPQSEAGADLRRVDAVLLRAQPLQHRPIELRREAGSNAEVAGAGGRVRSAVEPESGIRALAQGGPGVGRVDPPTEGRRVYPRTHTLTL